MLDDNIPSAAFALTTSLVILEVFEDIRVSKAFSALVALEISELIFPVVKVIFSPSAPSADSALPFSIEIFVVFVFIFES